MKKSFTVLVICLVSLTLWAQPPICGSNPVMTSTCLEACIICDINGFTGRNNSNVTGQAPPGFCTSFVHHMQWIGFIAGSTDLTISVTVFNCDKNEGLEIGLYKSLDCNTFSRVSECDTDIQENQVRVFSNTVPLEIGQYYYLVMDGSNNDICDYSVKVLSGSTKVLPLDVAPDIIIPDKACPNESFDVHTSGLVGATFYNWTVDGVFVKNGTSFTTSLEKPGTYKICLNASNVCDAAPEICKTIDVLPSVKSSFKRELCFGECFAYEGKDYCSTGNYDVVFPAANGCDSTVTLELIVADQIKESVSLYICEGDTLHIGNGAFSTAGIHQTIIDNNENCNILLTIDLKLIVCNIKSTESPIPVRCNAENSGIIRFEVDAGTPPFTYSGFKIENPSIVFDGQIPNLNLPVNIPGVDAGNYSFTILDNFGNSRILNLEVSQPTKLNITSKATDFNGYQVSCYGSENGSFKVSSTGGIPNYTYKHNGITITSDSISGLPSGQYTTIVTDKNGCTSSITTNINQPEKLELLADFNNPNCDGLATGSITVTSIKGGIPEYDISLNNGPKTPTTEYKNLSPGKYLLNIEDKNGCSISIDSSLLAPEIPEISAIDSDVTVSLGDSTMLGIISNLTEQIITWTPDNALACGKCPKTSARPVNDTKYIISVTSKDGCSRQVSINVKVDKKRSFVISNVMTPNGDQSNNKIRYFTGNDVDKVVRFAIYDRWGSLIYLNDSLPNGLSDVDWEGTFKGDKLVTGVYTWVAEVRYIDDLVTQYHGSMTILR